MSLFKFGKKIIPHSIKGYFSKFYYPLNNLVRHNTIDFFTAIEIETTTTCNRKCGYCPNSKYDRGNHLMEESLYRKIIDELAGLGYNGRISPHFYGEPLLDKRLPDLISYTRQKLPEGYIVVYTNGDMLTRTVFDNLIARGVDCFLVTQHIGVASPVLLETLNSLSNTDKERITFRKFDENSLLSNRGGLVTPKNVGVMKDCNFPSTSVVIDYLGNIILCCNDYFSTIKFGNLMNEKLIDIWNKQSYSGLRKALRNGQFNLDICKKCAGKL
jgi:radical SAM protein with 4Fe4S-binding SPASM domain